MRIIVLAVGRLCAPDADDVRHHLKLLARQARVETIEIRQDERISGRIPDRVVLLEQLCGGDRILAGEPDHHR